MSGFSFQYRYMHQGLTLMTKSCFLSLCESLCMFSTGFTNVYISPFFLWNCLKKLYPKECLCRKMILMSCCIRALILNGQNTFCKASAMQCDENLLIQPISFLLCEYYTNGKCISLHSIKCFRLCPLLLPLQLVCCLCCPPLCDPSYTVSWLFKLPQYKIYTLHAKNTLSRSPVKSNPKNGSH